MQTPAMRQEHVLREYFWDNNLSKNIIRQITCKENTVKNGLIKEAPTRITDMDKIKVWQRVLNPFFSASKNANWEFVSPLKV